MKYDSNMVYAECASPQGNLYLAATERGLAGMWFTDQRHLPNVSSWKRLDDVNQNHIIKVTLQQLEAYFAGKLQQFAFPHELPLDLSAGTPFQQAVWQALLKIPFGKTISYGELSSSMGKPLAVRAVGTAIGHNPISIVVPCHRVIGANGSLTGYAGGLHRKAIFLKLEGIRTSSLQGILV